MRASPQALTQGVEGQMLRQREHVAAGHLVERLQRGHHHDDERDEIDEREDRPAAHR